MAMVSGVSDALSVQHRSQTVSAPVGEQPALKQTETKQRTDIPTHRLKSYSRWAKVTQGQHKISASQVAEQGLRQITHLLKQLKKQSQKALSVEGQQQIESSNLAKQMQKRLSSIQVEYQNTPLIDHQLNLISPKRPAALYEFKLKSVELASPKPRDEQVVIQLAQKSASLYLPANDNAHQLKAKITKQMDSLGIGVSKSNSFVANTETIYTTNKSHWQTLKSGIMMTGQGQRLPAGEARTIKVDEQLSWQDPREWRFGTNEELKQAIAKINKSLHKVDQQLREIGEAKLKLQRQLDKLNLSQSDSQMIEETLNQLDSHMQSSPFYKQVTAVMAQANVTRSHVSSLLK
ncbi:hypothetical protein [Shewanella sp. UCD-KL12]|uniref:hypothetical protein n=1 Tax=Shewanella sp. UCD-KL12 TaxID=1917163 RepID=UPI002116E270|nr:hypothetical protein [Shewanella sp. UCD-KL12]